MKARLLFLAGSLIWLTSWASSRPELMRQPVRADDPKGLKLPHGVPRSVDPDGNVMEIDRRFTTQEYQRAAAFLLLQEANQVAKDMRLASEVLPITEASVTTLHVSPFGFSYSENSMGGAVATSNYVYRVGRDNKFCGLVVAGYDQICLKLKRTLVGLELMDTNTAYQLATQWLTIAGMNVTGLNRDCKPHVAVSLWNGLAKLGQMPSKDFAPIYYVWWTTPQNDAAGFGGVADVELFLPMNKLLQLDVYDPKYILRKPLVVTNLDSLFPGTGRVTVFPKARSGHVWSPGHSKR